MKTLTAASNRLTRSNQLTLGLASAAEQLAPMQMAEQYRFERHQRLTACRLIKD